MKRETIRQLKDSLPWYLNGTLKGSEKKAVETWLSHDPKARVELENWQNIKQMVMSQPEQLPAPDLPRKIWAQVLSSIEIPSPSVPLQRKRFAVYSLSVLVSVCVLALLWMIIRPVVILEWSVTGDTSQVFRVYRAPAGSQDFILVRELPAKPGEQSYSFVDTLFLPGQAYVYRIEAVDILGLSSLSQAAIENTMAALPGQLLILVASMLAGYGVALFLTTNSSPTLGILNGGVI